MLFVAIKFSSYDTRKYWYIVPETLEKDIAINSKVVVNSPFSGLTVVQVVDTSDTLPAGRILREMKEIVDIVKDHSSMSGIEKLRYEALKDAVDIMKPYLSNVRTCLTEYISDEDTTYKFTISFRDKSLYNAIVDKIDIDALRTIDDRVIDFFYDKKELNG